MPVRAYMPGMVPGMYTHAHRSKVVQTAVYALFRDKTVEAVKPYPSISLTHRSNINILIKDKEHRRLSLGVKKQSTAVLGYIYIFSQKIIPAMRRPIYRSRPDHADQAWVGLDLARFASWLSHGQI